MKPGGARAHRSDTAAGPADLPGDVWPAVVPAPSPSRARVRKLETSASRRPSKLRTRVARIQDLAALEGFISSYTGDGTLLARTRANLWQHVRDFRVVWDGAELVGCGALQLVSEGLAEIRSVAVHPERRGARIGSALVRSLLRDAHRLGLRRVFCLTRRVGFFARQGFVVVSKESFPHKVWNDCSFCPRQACCDEIAMQRDLAAPRGRISGAPGLRESDAGSEGIAACLHPIRSARTGASIPK